MDEVNENHWEVYNSAVDNPTSTDLDSHDHENEVHKEEGVRQNLTYLLGLKKVEVGELQNVKEQLEQENTKLQEEKCLLKTKFELIQKTSVLLL